MKKILAFSKKHGTMIKHGALAQLGARHTGSVEATGSSPVCSTVKGEDLIQVFAFLQLTFSQSDRGSAVREERR